MFSYQHRYHAGNFADVHKHLVLVNILEYLQKKETAFCALDLHAGEGIYDLQSAASKKTGEHLQGIVPLLTNKNTPRPALIEKYINIVRQAAPAPHSYPGSPAILGAMLRENDRGLLVEGHPQAFESLSKHFSRHARLHLHDRDSFEALQALVPFKEKRGLIFVDPSYEVKNEYAKISQAVLQAYEKFNQGIYAIWYPLLPAQEQTVLLTHIKRAKCPKVICMEWIPVAKQTTGLYGSGMIVINPPWQMRDQLQQAFAWLNQHVYPHGKLSWNMLSRPVSDIDP